MPCGRLGQSPIFKTTERWLGEAAEVPRNLVPVPGLPLDRDRVPGELRNRRKVEAAITNARATRALRDRGGLVDLIWSFRPDVQPAPEDTSQVVTTSPESVALSRALKAAGFAHVGPTTMYALMEAIGIIDTHLMGSHRRGASGVWPA